VCDTEIRTGLSRREVAGADSMVAAITEAAPGPSYPGVSKMAVKVVAEPPRRMLGAQIVGGEARSKRVDAFAVAIWNGMTVEEFAQLDLGYAPPFSTPIDVSLLAARGVRL
jgi:NADPH-dependent 2,4-dienoyl-CoA reductase/sulfur reductase-like enzyme